ncbi:MAG TPA: hypothetical protein VFX19_02850 [Dehalococcoidia bacterium]|jgi:hypothetical protein|nr:hypothetical protein [Dehalococcoidia bacterium]
MITPIFDLLVFALRRPSRWEKVERWLLRRARMGEPRLGAEESVLLSCLASFVHYSGGDFVPSSMGRLTLTTRRLFYAPSHAWLPKTEGKQLNVLSISLLQIRSVSQSDLNCSAEQGLVGQRTFFPEPTVSIETRMGRQYLCRTASPEHLRACLEGALADTGYQAG